MALSVLTASHSRAQAPAAPSNDQARAFELFQEGRRLLDAEQYAEACARFRASLALHSSPGSMLNVGDCFVRENDPVRALETYEDAERLAAQSPNEAARAAWLADARREIDTLNRQVTQVVLRVVPAPGLTLKLDGQLLESHVRRLRVASGDHVLEAAAPNRRQHRREFRATEGAQIELTLPDLSPLPSAEPLPVAQPVPPQHAAVSEPNPSEVAPQSSNHVPWILIGAGSAVVTAGVVTGLITASRDGELEQGCIDGGCPAAEVEPGWQDKIDAANRMAVVTNVLWGVGLATAAVGVTLMIFGDEESSREPTSQLQARCAGGLCQLHVSGQF